MLILGLLVLVGLVWGQQDEALEVFEEATDDDDDVEIIGDELDENQFNVGAFRGKRQVSSMWSCPAKPASTRSSRSKAILALYSPISRQDVSIYQTRTGWKESDVARLIQNGFDLNKPTIIYTHGYTQTIDRPWLMSVRNNFNMMYPAKAYRKRRQADNLEPQFNLMFYDWSAYGSRAYGTSASYVPFLGTVLSQFINDHLTAQYNYSASRVHIVSYSLSTHIAGQTGRKLKAKSNPLGQITAVDPTGVCFHQQNEYANKYSLKPSDAKLVVARHYNMGGLGAKRMIGGLDVIVNGGRDQPTMMPNQASAFHIVSAFGGSTSHARAAQHEAEPFQQDCHEIAYACKKFSSFLAGECADCGRDGSKCFHVSTFGNVLLNSNPATINYKQGTKMYLATGRLQFCLHNYQVLLKMSKKTGKSDTRAIQAGALSATVADNFRINPSHTFGTNQFSELVQSEYKAPRFYDEVKLDSGASVVDLSSVESIEINYMSNLSPEERRANSVRYCPRGGDTLVRC